MANVALVEKVPSKTDFIRHFDNDFQFDRFALCSDKTKKKILKRDVDIDINTGEYDFVVLVGSEALQHFTKERSITEHCGRLINDKFIPVINPGMLAFKPEAKPTWESSKTNILDYISGQLEDTVVTDEQARGIQDTEEANEWIRTCIDAKPAYIALDSETTGLYPRDGHMLGISLCYDGHNGVYIDTECFNVRTEVLLQLLFNQTTVVFHNAKFDIAFFEYHFNFEFPQFEDTMLLHYLIDEVPGTHGLKQLAMKWTPYGDYEQPMYEWIADYCKRTGTLKSNFTWDTIPFDIMKTYAAMDAVVTYIVYEKVVRIKTFYRRQFINISTNNF